MSSRRSLLLKRLSSGFLSLAPWDERQADAAKKQIQRQQQQQQQQARNNFNDENAEYVSKKEPSTLEGTSTDTNNNSTPPTTTDWCWFPVSFPQTDGKQNTNKHNDIEVAAREVTLATMTVSPERQASTLLPSPLPPSPEQPEQARAKPSALFVPQGTTLSSSHNTDESNDNNDYINRTATSRIVAPYLILLLWAVLLCTFAAIVAWQSDDGGSFFKADGKGLALVFVVMGLAVGVWTVVLAVRQEPKRQQQQQQQEHRSTEENKQEAYARRLLPYVILGAWGCFLYGVAAVLSWQSGKAHGLPFVFAALGIVVHAWAIIMRFCFGTAVRETARPRRHHQ